MLILEIILADHPSLTKFLLSQLSFNIISFIREFYIANIREENILSTSIQDFYISVIVKNKHTFLLSIIALISQSGEQALDNEGKGMKSERSGAYSIEEVLEVLQFFFSRLERIGNFILLPTKNKSIGTIPSEQ